MMISYPASIKYSAKDKVFNVEFPDLIGCISFGDSKKEAIRNAKEALTGYLESIDSRKLNVPDPSIIEGKDIYLITPDKNVSFAIWLKKNRQKQGLSQKQVAQKLKMAYQTYQRFEDPHKSNPTLKTIIRLEEVFQANLIQV
jgi:antitoxin HicB